MSHFDATVTVAKSPKCKQLSAALCLKISSEIDLTAKLTEKVSIRLRPKKSGKHRLIYDYGPKARACHRVVRTVLSAFHRPRPFQFTHVGHVRAVKRALTLIESGKLWFAHLDIKEFYPSFKIEKLLGNAALGGILPNSTVANLVHARGLEYVIEPGSLKRFPYLSYASLRLEARQGIPTGSCVSSLVAPMMVSRLQLSAAVAAILINYEDDFLLLATSEEELEQMIVALRAAVHNLPGGRFTLKLKSQGHLDQTNVDFLGHTISRKSGKTMVAVCAANQEQFFSMMADFDECTGRFKISKAQDYAQQRTRHCYQLRDYLRSWHQAFCLCGSDSVELHFIGYSALTDELKKLRKPLYGPSTDQCDALFELTPHFEISG